jgi:hypothetical protein
LDIVSPNLKPYTTYYDMMSYCDPEWISDYVYEALLSVHAAPAILQPDRSLNSTSLLVSGTIDAEGNVSLEPAFTLELPSRLPLPGSHTLELIDKRGVLLASYPFEPAVLHADRTGAPPTDEIRLFHLAVPYVDGVAELRVTEAGELRGTLRAGGALPHEIAGGLGVSDGRLYLPDALLHGSRGLMVRVSIDAGLSWQTVALGGPGLPAIDLAAFSGRSVLIQIHSSDGVQSVPILTGPLRIP